MNRPVLAWIIPMHYDPTAHPEHPIYYPPPGGQYPPRPEHPWVPPGEKPPTDLHPEHPIYWPKPGEGLRPEHPIVLPPPTDPPIKPPDPPLGSGTPGHPINNPPNVASPAGFHWTFVFHPAAGWFWALESDSVPQGGPGKK